MGQIVIAGFSSSNRVPGFYGENKWGVGPMSASSLPLIVLLVGLQATTAGTAVTDTEVKDVQSTADARTYFGQRSELSRMCKVALTIPGVTIKALSITHAGGAVAANFMFHVGGTWSTAGTLKWRIAGEEFELTIAASDTATTVGANIVTQLAASVDGPFTGVNTTGKVVTTCATKGTRGNDHVIVLDKTLVPSGMTIYVTGADWIANTAYTTGDYAQPTTANGYYYKATTGGTSHAVTEPTWPTTIGQTVVDSGVTWTCWGEILAGADASVTAIHPGGGSGTENVTTALATIVADQYDRIAIAMVDATNLGRWETQNDAAYGPTVGVLQQIVVAHNDSLASDTTLAQTTLNNQLFQFVYQLNGETPPPEVAALVAALRSATEQDDPAAMYDDVELPGVAPQAWAADRPTASILQSGVNNSLTMLKTEDGKVKIVRSITTYSLNGSTPDYSVLDTSEPTVGQFIRKDCKLLWEELRAQCPRVADDVPDGGRPRPSGVLTPSMATGYVTARLRDHEEGKNFPAPIIVNVDNNLPVSTYNSVADRIMTAVPIEVAKGNHQWGVSVRTVG